MTHIHDRTTGEAAYESNKGGRTEPLPAASTPYMYMAGDELRNVTIEKDEKILALRAQLAESQRMLREWSTTWQEMNAYINQAAEDAALCEAYEQALEEWSNNHLDKYKLEGRVVEDSYEIRFTVTSRRPRDANEIDYDAENEAQNAVEMYLSAEGHEDIDFHH